MPNRNVYYSKRSRRHRFNDAVTKLIAGLVIAALLVGGFFYARWEFRECRSVGHSTAYCWTHMGNN